MVKKTIKKSQTKEENINSCPKNAKCEKMFRILTIFLLVTLVIISTLILINLSSSQNNSKIEMIDMKVSNIDSFFVDNVPGYNSAKKNEVKEETSDINSDYKIDLDSLDDPMIGSKDAKITIVEFSDYECPFCSRFYSSTYKQLKAEYIDTGKVNLVFKDFPLDFHQNAKPAAIAANCVASQLGDDAYFKMHDKIFENQDDISKTNLNLWASELGVNSQEFDTCIESPEVIAEINADIAEGRKMGVSGTPSFLIDGELVVGAQPFSVFKDLIDSKLN